MKKVGLLISTMNSGGAERVVSHLTRLLGEKYEVHLILFEDTYMEYECAGQLHVLQVPATAGGIVSKLRLLFKRIKLLKGLIRQLGLSCVISFLDSPNFVNLLAGVRGCRRIISIRNYSQLKNSGTTLGKLTDIGMKWLYRRADKVVTVSRLLERDFATTYGVPAEKITTIYNPYNFEDMRQKGQLPLPEEAQDFFAEGFVFANVGRMVRQKGLWHLVKAFSLVHAKHQSAKLVLVGEDFTEGKLPKLLEDLQLTQSVLLTGRVRNPYQYLHRSHCYVLSSLFEGFPNALVEAMACGLPVIATDCPSGPREILYQEPDLTQKASSVTEADFGLLIPLAEAQEDWSAETITDGERHMARAMEQLLTDEEKRKTLADKALQRSHAFDFAGVLKAFSRVIE